MEVEREEGGGRGGEGHSGEKRVERGEEDKKSRRGTLAAALVQAVQGSTVVVC
jgi:hypothetical protein